MPTSLRLSFVLVTTLTVGATAASADASEINLPKAGDTSLSLGFPNGNNPYAAGTAGLWFMLSDQLNFGANVGIGLDFDTSSSYDFLLAPALRFYVGDTVRIRPFLLAQVNLRIFENPVTTDADINFGLLPGFGVELWIIDELSVSGHLGLGFDLYQGEGSSASIGTLTSGIQANLYFDLF